MPKGIVIVGLGPGSPDLLTLDAQRTLQAATEIYLRTKKHPTVAALPGSTPIYTFDEVYERAATFSDVYAEIAERIVALGGRDQGVVYAVPGNPWVGEESVRRIWELARTQGLQVRIVQGISFVEPTCSLLGLDLLDGVQIADATDLAMRHHAPFNPDLPLLVGQLYSRDLAADVKLALMTVYPDEHPITLVKAASTPDETLCTFPLYELDRSEEIDHLTSLYVPPLRKPGSLAAFQEIVARLRAPDGCPWDREQTHSSLRPYLLEETYEVLQALDREDSPALEEELGDLLLQILLHTQIAVEEQEFKMADVVSHIVAKLKRRHPHIFGNVQVTSSQDVLINWERIKSEERRAQNSQNANHESQGGGTLHDIPQELPALARAQSLQRRAARVGFEWPDVEAVWNKVKEEWQELRQAEAAEDRAAELGDVLFVLVSLARWLELDAESCLREATLRFEQRFSDMEQESAARGTHLTDLQPSEWDELWQKVKKRKS